MSLLSTLLGTSVSLREVNFAIHVASFEQVVVFADAGDESAGGYRKATSGKDINFLVIHRDAPIQFTKHLAPKVIPPEANPAADAWKFGYRMVGIADAYENKVAGIYLHHKA